MKESEYQARIISRLKDEFPGCVVLKNDASYTQGIPDLLVVYKDRWAMLEVKRSEREKARPNQKHYVNLLNDLSFASFIFPENEEMVFDELQHAFGVVR